MQLAGPAKTARGGELALAANIVRTGSAEAQQHVFRVTVTRPDGTDAPWFARNVVAPRGRASVVLPLAVDAPTGSWSVVVRDVLTGAGAAHGFLVEGG